MGFYREQVLPRLVDRACSTGDFRRLRARAAEGLSGEVLEIGFGSGLNLEAYPPEVRTVHAVEPSRVALRLAAKRIEASAAQVVVVGLDGESIPLDDRSCDAAMATFTLCTIPDVDAALAEVRRVIGPGGRLHFLEHGRSPDPSVATWQRRLEPLQQRVADGCHLTRDPIELVERAGFEIERSSSFDAAGPAPWTWLTAGVAVVSA